MMSDEIRRPNVEANGEVSNSVPQLAGMIVIGALVGLVVLAVLFRGYNAA